MNAAPSTKSPSSTYRLQFSPEFRIHDAEAIVGYLDELGIGAAYCSPLFRARAGSTHGYDVIDPSRIHPQLGRDDEFQRWAENLASRGLGVVLDIVPNHMGITDPNNAWWHDVLENGPSSAFARCFDIDWDPPKENLRDKVILPFLGDQFGRVLENQQLTLKYEAGRFFIAYYENRYPLAPRSWRIILRTALEQGFAETAADDPDRAELESIITSLDHLPPRTERDPLLLEVRMREKAVAQRRIRALLESSDVAARSLDEALERINGTAGDPSSFDLLEAILDDQAYRLSYWRVAAEEINYRRFFDINDLAAVRVEEPRVFSAAHELMLKWMARGLVTGLRIDHVDGLWDPKAYLHDLQEACRNARRAAHPEAPDHDDPPTYILVEKILGHHETLPDDWPVAGTTGYEFMNAATGVLVDRHGARELWEGYRREIDLTDRFSDVVYQSKLEIMRTSMTSELHVLARTLDRISEQHRYTRDFTFSNLQTALAELIACFPVYRTYIRPETGTVGEDDRRKIAQAVGNAKRRNPGLSGEVFDFIVSLLQMDEPPDLTELERHERLEFIRRFQQLTGPVTAKGIEDTTFYRVYPLASLNEVGGHPWLFGTSIEEFHRDNTRRLEHWPLAMTATSTHDTKRSEDTRARINTLSEVPRPWEAALARWRRYSEPFRTALEGEQAPDVNEQSLFFQTLIGIWPLQGFRTLDDAAWEHFTERLVAYMGKAAKEAKLNTSWLLQNAEHDETIARYVRACLDRQAGGELLEDVEAFVTPLVDAGLCNALAQVLLKSASPGVPDFYQGTEFWQFTLVDPDNRSPVDYEAREDALTDLQRRWADNPAGLVDELVAQRHDGRIKQFLTWRALTPRRRWPELFVQGEYLPLAVRGVAAEHVMAFARRWQERWAVCVVPRLPYSLPSAPHWPLGDPAWQDTAVELPPDAPTAWTDTLTGQAKRSFRVAELLNSLPVSLLLDRTD